MEPAAGRSWPLDGSCDAIRFTLGDTTPYRRSRMEERKLLLAVALSLLVLTAYSMLFPPAPARPRVPASGAPTPAIAPSAAPPAASARPPAETPQTNPVESPSAVRVADERERRIEVESPQGAIAFTNKGARLLSWQLARFKDKRGHPEEMVQAVTGGPRPLDIETGDAVLDARLKDGLFLASAETLQVPAQGPAVLRFEYADGEIQVEKSLTFDARKPLVEVSARVSRKGLDLPLKILWGPGIGNPTPAEKEVQGYAIPQGVALVGGAVERAPTAKLAEARKLGPAQWAGMESHYFAALFVPPGGLGGAEVRPVALPPLEDGKPRPEAVMAVELSPGAGPAELYVGPKDYQELELAGHGLSRVALAQMGDWIGPPIVVPLMNLVRRVHASVGSYGWSIVLVTIFINLVMAPFRHYSIANGRKMAKISPEMKVIQERYRKVPLMDPKRQVMQEEMASLYAKHGMNMSTQMMVGCLPILLTMPFLIAFYRVLSVSIDLRGAPFFWIPDLSQKDPLFLTPVLMGISMFAMQRMTPTVMEPAQQRIMMLMPLMLAGMLLWAPAGLNVYWLSSNLCAIVQQTVTYALLRRSDAASARGRK
jgi:YidC/Oxa1 family membrane protein insertase